MMIPISSMPKRFPAALGNGGRRTSFMTRVLKPKSLSVGKYFSTVSAGGIANPTIVGAVTGNSFSTLPRPASFPEEFLDSSEFSQKTTSVRTSHIPTSVSSHIFNKSVITEVARRKDLNLFGEREAAWWTGKAPEVGKCAGVEADGRIYSVPQFTFEPPVASADRAAAAALRRVALQDYFDNTWTLTEVLLSSLQGEEAFMRPPYHDLRHPMIFYYGHPAALYINKLRVAGLLTEPINPYFEVIFETGVDEMSWDDLSKNKMAWPSVAEVHQYRAQVYETVSTLIANLSEQQLLSINQESPLWALVMAFEHERIHLETSSFLISELPLEFVSFPKGFPSYHPSAQVASENTSSIDPVKTPVAGVHYPVNRMIPVPQTDVTLGKSREFASFGWDNEYGQRTYTVPAFKTSEFKITNGEFLEFMVDGGYARNEFWTTAGWEWRAFRNVKMPTHFVRAGPQGSHEYVLRLLFDTTQSVPWDWPVVVSLHEAAAFAKWKSAKTGKQVRVLTELEHRAIRDGATPGPNAVSEDPVTVRGGHKMMNQAVHNTNLGCASMSPVNALQPNAKGFYDVFGNAWEWTSDYFCALPGFQVHPYYEDFSTPCFDGLHHVIQGGSFISTGNECSVHSRFHFRPHFYQHAGFRIVEAEDPAAPILTSDTDAPGPYVGAYPFRRTQKAVEEITRREDARKLQEKRNADLLKHFAASPSNTAGASVMQQFGELILEQARKLSLPLNQAHLLEVGCGPGGLTYSLAAQCGENASIIGVDHSAHSIDTAKKLLQGESLTCTLSGEGTFTSTLTVAAPVKAIKKCQIDFRMSDPMCLPAEMQDFDLVVLHDVLDTLASPNSLLGRVGGLRGLVKSGGLLAVSSAYQWREECTPKELWLGGYEIKNTDGTTIKVKSEETLVERLNSDFTHLRTQPLTQVWPEGEHQVRGKTYSLSFFQRK
uniref:Generic methyltransferase n=1 Tax=Spumella elongata TaxID=89044 RepID=A0A7S3GUJ5_9STRA|mmetsp:Transcript_20077/g.34835  ORF Transcript_20077/g.34835 Transcript_20077/m.34835 type:complete len:940 (+) Transcript_20077:56-2875(+)